MTVRVAVVGAGIGGLTLGIALQQAGVQVDVYERSDELREVGAAVALSANGTRPLYRLGLGEVLDVVSTQPTELIYRDGRSGERIAAHPGGATYRERFGAPYWGVHRADLQQALAGALDDDHLHLGRSAMRVDDHAHGAAITLADGTTVTADVVVGADGVHSTVRDHVAGPDSGPAYSGTSAFRGLVPRDGLPTLPDPLAIQFWTGPGAHMLHYTLGEHDDTVNFLAVLTGPEHWVGGNRSAEPGELLAAFAGWHPAVIEMLGAVEQSPRWPLFSQPHLAQWKRGRVILIGDASHAMLPHHGQGANQSIEDAITLAGLIASVGDNASELDVALERYLRQRRSRTRAVSRSAWETGTLLHVDDDDAAGLRDRDERFAGYLDDNAWVHEYDAGPTHHGRRPHSPRQARSA